MLSKQDWTLNGGTSLPVAAPPGLGYPLAHPASLDAYGRLNRLDARAVNATKLVFCAQFVLLAPGPE